MLEDDSIELGLGILIELEVELDEVNFENLIRIVNDDDEMDFQTLMKIDQKNHLYS